MVVVVVLLVLRGVFGLFGVDFTDPCEAEYGQHWMTDSDLDGSQSCVVPGTEGSAPHPDGAYR